MTTLIDEAKRILDVGQIYPSEIDVVSCDAKDPARTDDDVCVIRERGPADPRDSEGTTREVLVDDLFNLSNLRNLERGTPRESDFKNYYFRLDPNLALIRQGNVRKAGMIDDGIFYRPPGSLDWRRLGYSQIQEAPDVKAAILPLLRKTVRGGTDYERLNNRPHREGDDRLDYEYARNTAIEWLVGLAPQEDAETDRVLLQAFPSLSAESARSAFFRLSSGDDNRSRLVPMLTAFLADAGRREAAIGMLGDLGPIAKAAVPDLVRLRETGSPQERNLAKEALSNILPAVTSEDWSLETVVKPRFSWEGSGGVYIPLPLRRAPENVSWRGQTEPVGSYVAAGAGFQLCIGPRIDCAQREGLRIGLLAEAGAILSDFGSYFFDGKVFVGNENIVGYAQAGLSVYPTGGFMGEGNYGEIVYKPTLGAGVRVIPHLKYFPFAIPAGVRLDPTDPRNLGIYLGLGGAQ